MAYDENWISKFLGRVVDGKPIDWDHEIAEHAADREFISAMRFLDGVAELHDAATASWSGPLRGDIHPLEQGELFAERYRIESELGRGGFGIVYRAFDEGPLQRPVALKIVSPLGMGDGEGLFREARIAAQVRHPGIAQVYDAGQSGSQAFMVQELIPGRDLSTLVALEGRLSLPRIALLAREIAAALDVAHAAGVVHRDIKSRNIIIDADGHAKITDFGIAQAVGVGSLSAELVPGTPGFAAPEQLRGLSTDHRVDIFAFGCVLYQMLTGMLPFSGRHPAEVIRRTLYDDPVPPHDIRPDIPRSLSDCVMKCLSKRPNDRFGSSAALAARLQQTLGSQGRGRTVSRRILLGGISALLIVVAILVGGRFYVLSRSMFARGDVITFQDPIQVKQLGMIRYYQGVPDRGPIDGILGFPRFLEESDLDITQFPEKWQEQLARGVAFQHEDSLIANMDPVEAAVTRLVRGQEEEAVQQLLALSEEQTGSMRQSISGLVGLLARGSTLTTGERRRLVRALLNHEGRSWVGTLNTDSIELAAIYRGGDPDSALADLEKLIETEDEKHLPIRALGFLPPGNVRPLLLSLLDEPDLWPTVAQSILDAGECPGEMVAEARRIIDSANPRSHPYRQFSTSGPQPLNVALTTIETCGDERDTSRLEALAIRYADTPLFTSICSTIYRVGGSARVSILLGLFQIRPLESWVNTLGYAIPGIANATEPQFVSLHRDALGSDDDYRRSVSAEVLGRLGFRDGLRGASECCLSADDLVCQVATRALFWGRSPRIRETLLGILADSTRSEQLRSAAVLSLSHYPMAEVGQALVKLLDRGDPFLREAAVQALVADSMATMVDWAELEGSQNASMRVYAAFAQVKRGENTSQTFIDVMANLKDSAVRDDDVLERAILGLRDVCRTNGADFSIEMLESPYRFVRFAASAALIDVDEFPSVESSLSTLTQSPRPAVRGSARRTLWGRDLVRRAHRELDNIQALLGAGKFHAVDIRLKAEEAEFLAGRSGFPGALTMGFGGSLVRYGGTRIEFPQVVNPLEARFESLIMMSRVGSGNLRGAIWTLQNSQTPEPLVHQVLEDDALSIFRETYAFRVLAGLEEPKDPWAED